MGKLCCILYLQNGFTLKCVFYICKMALLKKGTCVPVVLRVTPSRC